MCLLEFVFWIIIMRITGLDFYPLKCLFFNSVFFLGHDHNHSFHLTKGFLNWWDWNGKQLWRTLFSKTNLCSRYLQVNNFWLIIVKKLNICKISVIVICFFKGWKLLIVKGIAMNSGNFWKLENVVSFAVGFHS